jgi:hypothetical protein
MNKFYLCYQNKTSTIWQCNSFDHFLEADNYYDTIDHNNINFSTILSVSTIIPQYFHKYRLQKLLMKQFCNVTISTKN